MEAAAQGELNGRMRLTCGDEAEFLVRVPCNRSLALKGKLEMKLIFYCNY